MLYPGSVAGRTFISVSFDCRVVAACADLAATAVVVVLLLLLFSGASASCALVEAVALFLRGTGAALGSLVSRGLRPRLGLASVLVAEAPSTATGTFGLRPGFFLVGGAEGSDAV